jgi:S1-C subfamily serine protease
MRVGVLLVAAVAACAQAQVSAPVPQDSIVPGTIGVVVREVESRVVIAAVGEGSPAAQSGLRVGDVVVRFNGQPVGNSRQFYRMVVDAPPGSVARLDVLRDGTPRVLEVPVEQLDLLPRV